MNEERRMTQSREKSATRLRERQYLDFTVQSEQIVLEEHLTKKDGTLQNAILGNHLLCKFGIVQMLTTLDKLDELIVRFWLLKLSAHRGRG